MRQVIRRRNCPQRPLRCSAAQCAQRSAAQCGGRHLRNRQRAAKLEVLVLHSEPNHVATRCTGLQHVVLSVAAYSVQHAPYTTQDATDNVQDTVCKIQRTTAGTVLLTHMVCQVCTQRLEEDHERHRCLREAREHSDRVSARLPHFRVLFLRPPTRAGSTTTAPTEYQHP